MRPIDADGLKNSVLKWLPFDPCGQEEKEYPFETDICVSVMQEIEDAPTIEPERKKGRWVAIEGKDDCFECSECHSVIEGNEVYWRDNYFCYHCGADMR